MSQTDWIGTDKNEGSSQFWNLIIEQGFECLQLKTSYDGKKINYFVNDYLVD